jgi:hypothetical protein
MGRRPWTNRLTVEDCLCLSITDLYRDGVFHSPTGSKWVVKRSNGDGDSISYTVVEVRRFAMGLRLCRESADGDSWARTSAAYTVPVTSTRPHLGGRRLWLLCPLVRDGIRCGRRVGRLYLPPGQQVLACRLCYNLTYRSAQQHDKRKDALLRNPIALVDALRSDNPRRKLVGIDAYMRAVGRLKNSV